MQANQNKNWKDRIRELTPEDIGMETLDIDLEWKTFKNRMKKERSPRRFIYFSAAAAAVTIILSLISFLKKEDPNNELVERPPVMINKTKTTPAETGTAIQKEPYQVRSDKPRNKILNNNVSDKSFTKTVQLPVVADSSEEPVDLLIIQPDMNKPVVSVQKKKTLKTIHNDDLPDRSLPTNTMATSSFPFFQGQEDYQRSQPRIDHSINTKTQN